MNANFEFTVKGRTVQELHYQAYEKVSSAGFREWSTEKFEITEYLSDGAGTMYLLTADVRISGRFVVPL